MFVCVPYDGNRFDALDVLEILLEYDHLFECFRASGARMENKGWRMEEDSLHGLGDGADDGDVDDDSMMISSVATCRDRQLSFVG